jgi:DUF438 domain-containing protein
MLKSAVEELAKNESKQEIMELGKDIEAAKEDAVFKEEDVMEKANLV